MTTTTARSIGSRRRRSLEPGWRGSAGYLLPAVLLYGVFLIYPMLDSVRMSFVEWDGYLSTPQVFVGIDNYVRLFAYDPVFWTAARNSVVWVALSLLIPMVLSLVLAIALNRSMIGRNVFRSIFYIPSVFASITVAAMWRWIYNPTLGILNQLLETVGLGSWTREWLADPSIALYSVFAAGIWQGVGFNMVIFLAGLQQVPQEQVDAARVDGANRWDVFRYVTLPALRPTTTVVITMTIINSLKVFDLIVGMTNGGPAQATQVLALWSYTQSFSNHNFGQAAAVATVLLLLSLALVVPYLVWSMRRSRS